METVKRLSNKGIILQAFLACSIVLLSYAQASTTNLPLTCLERDWFTLFAKQGFDVTNLEIAVTDSKSGLSRILIAVSDQDRRTDERNSQLAYLDYETCQPLFFIRNSETYQAGMNAIAVHTTDMSKYKPFETIYQVGKIQDETEVIVTIIENEKLYKFAFETTFLAHSNYDREAKSRGQLIIIQPRIILWQHAYGVLLIDLDSKIARSLHLSRTYEFTSLVTAPYQFRYLNTISWEKSYTSTDSIWLHSYDLTRLGSTSSSLKLVNERRFSIGDFVEGVVIADTLVDSTALCFIDSQLDLNLAFWEPKSSNSLYRARMNGLQNSQTQFEGCATIELIMNQSGSHEIKVLIYTTDGLLALLTQEIGYRAKQGADSGQVYNQFSPYTLSLQKFYIFSDLTSLQFSSAPGFISTRATMLGGSILDTWGFVLFTDDSNQRRTQLWGARSYVNSNLDRIVGDSQTSNAYESDLIEMDRGSGIEQALWASAYPYNYNDWIPELCELPQPVTKVGDDFSLNYPELEEFTLRFDQLIETDLDKRNSWQYTCFPTIDLALPSSIASQFSIVEIDQRTSKFELEVEKVAQANIYIRRNMLLGQGKSFYEQYKYGMKLSDLLASKYEVGFVNFPPEIIEPAPVNNQIFLSIQWAPNPLYDRTSLLEDIEGRNRDLLWESGTVIDNENDEITLKMPVLYYLFNVELSQDKKVRITMARKMHEKFTGIHRFNFELSDDGELDTKNTYEVIIVIGLYDADLTQITNPSQLPNDEIDFNEIDDSQVLPPQPVIESTEEWWQRIPYDERKAQIRVNPISTDGRVHVAFTKSVEFPDKILDIIAEFRLVNVTFVPKTYDFIDEQDGKTELKEWTIERINSYGMDIKVVFANPNLVGYSIHESDQIFLDFDFTQVKNDNSTMELYGRYVKSIPLQYPDEFTLTERYFLKEVLDQIPTAMITLLLMCGSLLAISISVEQTSIIWLIMGHLQLVVFLPMMNVPVPAQVNDISKILSSYMRLDFLTVNGQSVMTQMAQYIFNFPTEKEVMPLHFEQLGFSSRNSFETAFGLNFVHCMIVIPVGLLLIIFGVCKLRYKWCSSAFVKLRAMFYNSFYIRYNLETYIVYAVCNMLKTQDISFYNWAYSLQTLVSGMHLTWLAAMPLIIAVFFTMNYSKLVSNKNFRTTWGAIYVGLIGDFESTKTKNAIGFKSALTARMFAFAFASIVLRNYWVVQIAFLFFTTAIIIHLTCQESINGPYQSKMMNNLQVFLDTMLMLLIDFMVAFNGGGFISTDQSVRFAIGWAYTSVLGFSLVVCYSVLVLMTLRIVQRTMLIQQVKISKTKLRLEKRKTRMMKRSMNKMQTLRAQNLRGVNQVISVGGVESNSSSFNDGTPLNSPGADKQIVLQSEDEKLAVQLDQDDFKRGLTEIVEGCSDEEDSSGSSDSFVSDLSGSQGDSFYLGAYKPPQYVMGFNLLPQLARQGVIKNRPKTVPPRGTRPNDTSQLLGLGVKGSRKNLMKLNNSRNSNSTPPMIPKVVGFQDIKRKQKEYLADNSSSQEGEESFKASSRINQSVNFERHGNLTGKHKKESNSFSHQIATIPMRHETNSQFDRMSMHENTDRGLLSQQETKRDSKRESQRSKGGGIRSKVSSAKKSNRSNKFLDNRQHMHSALSRRSSESNLSRLDDAVSTRLEQIVEMKVEQRRATLLKSKPETSENIKLKGSYVMGQQMAKESMMLDMTNNIMVMSNIHTSTSELSPIGNGLNKRKNSSSFDSQQMNVDLSNQNRKRSQELHKVGNDMSQQKSRHSRLTSKAQSMMNPQLGQVADLIQRGPTPTLSMEQVSERAEEKEASQYKSSQRKIQGNYQTNIDVAIMEENLVISSPNSEEPDGRMAIYERTESSQFIQLLKQDTQQESIEKQAADKQCQSSQESPLRTGNYLRKQSNKSQQMKEFIMEPPSKQNFMNQSKPGPAQVIVSSESSYSNKELNQIVDCENKRYEKQIILSAQRESRRSQAVANQASPAPEETPYFHKVQPNFNHSVTITSKEDKSNSSRRVSPNPQSLSGTMRKSSLNHRVSNQDVNSFGELSLDRRLSSQSKRQTRPADMPILNLDQDNLLAGINQRVANRMKLQPQRTISMASEMSEMSKFTIEDDNNSLESPENVRFTSMKK